jgi:hypothetical protein
MCVWRGEGGQGCQASKGYSQVLSGWPRGRAKAGTDQHTHMHTHELQLVTGPPPPPPPTHTHTRAHTSFSVRLSSAEVASSHSSTRGDLRKARASATRCFSPPLRSVRVGGWAGGWVRGWGGAGAEGAARGRKHQRRHERALKAHAEANAGVVRQPSRAPELEAALPHQRVVAVRELQHLVVDGGLRRDYRGQARARQMKR